MVKLLAICTNACSILDKIMSSAIYIILLLNNPGLPEMFSLLMHPSYINICFSDRYSYLVFILAIIKFCAIMQSFEKSDYLSSREPHSYG